MGLTYHAVLFTDITTRFHSKTLGAYRIASELRSHGYRVLVIDYLNRWLIEPAVFLKLLKKVISKDTLFLGYSGTFITNITNKSTNKNTNRSKWSVDPESIAGINHFIKKLNPSIKIIYGGAQANIITDEILNCGIDYIVQGFADSTIVDIITALDQNKSPRFSDSIKGVKIIKYDAKGLNFDFRNRGNTVYTNDDFIIPGETLPIEISRGCMFKCSFCSFPLLGRNKHDLSYVKDPAILTKELVYNYEKFNTTNYMITDDTFNESTEKILTVKKAINDSGVNIRFFAYLRADILARFPEQMDILIDMGLMTASFGIETLNHKSAKSVGKGLHPDRVKECLLKFKNKSKGQIVTHGNFIAGLPHDTEQSLNDDMQWVFDNEDFLDTYDIHTLSLTQGDVWSSEITQEPEKYGYKIFNNGTRWENSHMNIEKAKEISDYWNSKGRNEGRQKIGSMMLMSGLNFGYDYDDLYAMRSNNMPLAEIDKRSELKWQEYQQLVFNLLA